MSVRNVYTRLTFVHHHHHHRRRRSDCEKKNRGCACAITESDLYPFFFFSYSVRLFSLLYHPQNNETNCSRKKRCVFNSLIQEFTSMHILQFSHKWLIDLSREKITFLSLSLSLSCIVPDHEAERWMSIQSIEYNKTWTKSIHHHHYILHVTPNQISMSFNFIEILFREQKKKRKSVTDLSFISHHSSLIFFCFKFSLKRNSRWHAVYIAEEEEGVTLTLHSQHIMKINKRRRKKTREEIEIFHFDLYSSRAMNDNVRKEAPFI